MEEIANNNNKEIENEFKKLTNKQLRELEKLANDDFARSLLTPYDRKKLGSEVLVPEKTLEIFGWPYVAMEMPYYDPITGERVAVRARFLEDVIASNDKLIRYTQKANSENHLFFSKLYKNWARDLKCNKTTLIFTEGEKKASCACKLGLMVIGLPGVWAFKNKKQQKRLIDDFKLIALKGRPIELCFDSDFRSNQDVMKALRALAKELTREGAEVSFRWLPDDTGKIGLDDFFEQGNSLGDYDDLPLEPYTYCEQLIKFNETIAYIEEMNVFRNVKRDITYKTKAALEQAYAPLKITNTDDKEVKVSNTWIEWEHRRSHSCLVYDPAKNYSGFEYPLITKNNELNTWRGWGVKPVKGDIKPFMDLVEDIFKYNPEGMDYFMQWLAYPLQHPGTKLSVAVMIQSIIQGAGKSFIGLIMGDIYGENFSVVEEQDLEKDFNAWSVNKQFVLGDEITGNEYDKRKSADRIKNIITRETITVNVKYQPTYKIKDCINYFMTSNHPDALYLENKDRRWFIHSFSHKPADLLFKRLDKWRKLNNKLGPSALFYHLLFEVNCKKFNPLGAAPMSSAKTDMQDTSRSDLEDFANQIAMFPESALHVDGIAIDRDLFDIKHLIKIHDAGKQKETSATAMGKALRRAGFYKVANPIKFKTSEGKSRQCRFWVLNHLEKWRDKEHAEYKEHYENSKIGIWPRITVSRGKEKKY